ASDDHRPVMKTHHDRYYGGVSWANELAKRGYAVLVHDAFLFGSRRVRLGDLPKVLNEGRNEVQPDSVKEVEAYNKVASNHEHVVAKSLFCAGTTWPGGFTAEGPRGPDDLWL